MLLRLENLNFITLRNSFMLMETMSTCSRKKCHFNVKVLPWSQEEDRAPSIRLCFGGASGGQIQTERQAQAEKVLILGRRAADAGTHCSSHSVTGHVLKGE